MVSPKICSIEEDNSVSEISDDIQETIISKLRNKFLLNQNKTPSFPTSPESIFAQSTIGNQTLPSTEQI